ncbi:MULTISPECIES: hypothetical protein [Capnocytophaga]|uniref:hypothetical protein n=1 Tax=Capnocytophaga TaxID=1016 RepID=UPI001EE066E2|nr:hypothetical protein [Capnocytophaga canimorsus]GJQ04372.1 hypothetical protein CAPN009_07870 [Capnocytophaga canimorsus]
MHLDEIREKIANKLQENFDTWNDVLNNTSPGNYGCNEWNVEVSYEDVYVDIPKKQFKAEGVLNADLVMGASRGDTSFEQSYNKPFKAKGEFIFSEDGKDVEVKNVEVSIDPHIFE